jgi:hypothetical protein
VFQKATEKRGNKKSVQDDGTEGDGSNNKRNSVVAVMQCCCCCCGPGTASLLKNQIKEKQFISAMTPKR